MTFTKQVKEEEQRHRDKNIEILESYGLGFLTKYQSGGIVEKSFKQLENQREKVRNTLVNALNSLSSRKTHRVDESLTLRDGEIYPYGRSREKSLHTLNRDARRDSLIALGNKDRDIAEAIVDKFLDLDIQSRTSKEYREDFDQHVNGYLYISARGTDLYVSDSSFVGVRGKINAKHLSDNDDGQLLALQKHSDKAKEATNNLVNDYQERYKQRKNFIKFAKQKASAYLVAQNL